MTHCSSSRPSPPAAPTIRNSGRGFKGKLLGGMRPYQLPLFSFTHAWVEQDNFIILDRTRSHPGHGERGCGDVVMGGDRFGN